MIATRTLESDNLEIPAPALATHRPGLIVGKIAELMKRVGAVGKNGKTEQGPKYAYRKLDDIYGAVQQHMAELGVLCYPARTAREHEERATRGGEGVLTFTRMTVTYRWLAAEDGSWVDQEVCGEGMDSSDKSTNKATSAAEKYALVTMLKLPSELIDSETESPRPAPRQQQQQQPAPPRRPGPAPVVQPPPFAKLVRSKLEDRGLRGEEVERAVRAIAEGFEAADLAVLGREDQARVLRGIAQGAADKYKLAKAS